MVYVNEIPAPYVYEHLVTSGAERQNPIERLYQNLSSLARFRASFISILDALKNEENEEESFAQLNSIEHLIMSDMLTWEEQQHFMNAPENATHIARLRKLNIFVDFCYERLFCQSILKGEEMNELRNRSNPLFHPYLERFDTLARNEVELLKLSEKDTLLFIGGGAFPISAIQYVKQTGCTVHCVEKLPERAELAEQVISALGMADRIKIILAEGEKLDCSPYDAIVVGVLAIPKKEIIKSILNSANEKVRIICRTTMGVREALLTPMKSEEALSLKELIRTLATEGQILTPVLYSLP